MTGLGSARRITRRTGVGLMLCGVLSAAARPALSQDGRQTTRESKRHLPAGFLQKTLRLEENGQEYKYVVFIPPQYKVYKGHKWAMIVFLHGSGEIGVDGTRQTTVGLPVYISYRPSQFPFIVLMPQAHAVWFRGVEATAVWKMIAATKEAYDVDDDRVYITGLSMGAFGAWELAMSQPDLFAAIVPVCGAAPKEYLGNVANIPVWAFHGALDKNVPVSGSREAIKELRALGGVWPKYTEYPDLPHECWDRAYATQELWSWLLAQRRRMPRVIDFRLPHGTARVWWLVVKAEAGLKAPAHIHAEIDEKGGVKIESEGVESWGLLSDRKPLPPGSDINVTWNGAVVFRGAFKGALFTKPQHLAATSGPAPAGG